MTMTIESAALHRLLAWMSPGYPIGAFSYSHGLEQAVEDGAVKNRADLVNYVSTVLERGGGWIDAVLFAHAWRAEDLAACADLADLAGAFRSSAETALESRQQGAAFLAVTRAAWPHAALDAFANLRTDAATPSAIVAAIACRAHAIGLIIGLEAFLHGFAANLISAGLRLIPLGQTDGQIALADLTRTIARVAEAAMNTDLDDLGANAWGLDMLSMRHETQYTRLFRS